MQVSRRLRSPLRCGSLVPPGGREQRRAPRAVAPSPPRHGRRCPFIRSSPSSRASSARRGVPAAGGRFDAAFVAAFDELVGEDVRAMRTLERRPWEEASPWKEAFIRGRARKDELGSVASSWLWSGATARARLMGDGGRLPTSCVSSSRR